MNSEC